jgi:hypothetical protein
MRSPGSLLYAIFAAVLAGGCNLSDPNDSTAAAPADSTAVTTETAAAAPGRDATPGAPEADRSLLRSFFSREPAFQEVTLPAGTRLPVTLETAIGSDISRVEEPVQARLSSALLVDGQTVLPAGTRVTGVVTNAARSGKVKGRAQIGVRFDTLLPEGPDVGDEHYAIATRPIGRTAPATKRDDALKIGAPAAGGAIVGAMIGGKKGAAVGTAVGGGAGTALVLSTPGEEVRLARGTALSVELAQPVTLRVRAEAGGMPAR